MCAIAGVIGSLTPQTVIENMLKTMQRRGPDGQGTYQHGTCCLLHTRLAVIDPLGGAQPMTCRMGELVYTIVYNGELYNTAEIRNELQILGHNFQTSSDTEVVLHAYIQWKEDCLTKLNGIYAFGVWEDRSGRLFLARDRIGVKPLFYTLGPYGLCFASEIKTILAHPKIPAQINSEGIAQLLLLGPGRAPGSGVFCGIEELRPGCYGVYENGVFYWKRYWKLKDKPHEETFEETAEHVRYLVTDAIQRQMVSDVPIGTFLSGGLDSSLISSICAGVFAEKGEKLKTFSVGYVDQDKYFVPGKFQPNADDHYIDIMHSYILSDHKTTYLSPEDLIGVLDDATAARDLPGMADVDFSLFAFSKEIRKDVKVALSGECADEIFGGYPWYRDPEIRAAEGFPWAQNTGFRAGFIHPQHLKDIRPNEYVMDHYRTTVHQSDILPDSRRIERRMKEMVNLNFEWFMQTLLDRKDRMSMYHSLEVRVPFCDYRIAEYLYSVPWDFKDYGNREKGLLRYAMRDYLPDEILHRKKSPYPKTYDPRYTELVTQMLENVIADSNAPLLNIVRKDALEKLLLTEFSWPWYGQLMKLPQTIAYMLQINRWLQLYNIQVI